MGRRKGSIDMLSGLPDEILHHILSFLLTKFSVRTSALAKRWRFLWKHVPNLEFYEDNSDNINRVITQHEAKTLNTFMLYCVKGSAYQLETLIFYPIKCGVRNLYIEFNLRYGGDIACTVPRLLFTCKTLVDLKFYFCGVIPSSGELFLPSLKKLNLSNVQYESDESLPHLLSGCPVLEELIVNDTFRNEQKNQKNSGCVIVSSPTIKTLNVYFCHRHRGEQQLDEMLIIDVPALVYLQVNRCDLDSIKSLRKTMTSLNEVGITLNGDWHMCGIDCNEHGRAIEFLSCLCHVKYLSIKSGYEESLFDIVGNGLMPKFVNLTKLELSLIFDWDRLVKFLEVADNLEVIVFNSGCMPYNEPRLVPTCMLSRLRKVKMYRFIACQYGLDMFKYILKNAKVLEMMEIDPDFLTDDNCDKENYDAFRRISLFERASKSCHLVFGWSIQGIVLSIDSNTLFNF